MATTDKVAAEPRVGFLFGSGKPRSVSESAGGTFVCARPYRRFTHQVVLSIQHLLVGRRRTRCSKALQAGEEGKLAPPLPEPTLGWRLSNRPQQLYEKRTRSGPSPTLAVSEAELALTTAPMSTGMPTDE